MTNYGSRPFKILSSFVSGSITWYQDDAPQLILYKIMTKNNLVIRPMRAMDVKKACKLIKSLAASFGDKAKVTERDLRSGCFGKNKLSTIILAFIGNKPVGLAITRDWMNFYLGIKFRHIDFLFVDDKFCRQGIGTKLIKDIARTSVKDGCRILGIDAGIDNKAANDLYKKLGFEVRSNKSANYRLSGDRLAKLAKASS